MKIKAFFKKDLARILIICMLAMWQIPAAFVYATDNYDVNGDEFVVGESQFAVNYTQTLSWVNNGTNYYQIRGYGGWGRGFHTYNVTVDTAGEYRMTFNESSFNYAGADAAFMAANPNAQFYFLINDSETPVAGNVVPINGVWTSIEAGTIHLNVGVNKIKFYVDTIPVDGSGWVYNFTFGNPAGKAFNLARVTESLTPAPIYIDSTKYVVGESQMDGNNPGVVSTWGSGPSAYYQIRGFGGWAYGFMTYNVDVATAGYYKMTFANSDLYYDNSADSDFKAANPNAQFYFWINGATDPVAGNRLPINDVWDESGKVAGTIYLNAGVNKVKFGLDTIPVQPNSALTGFRYWFTFGNTNSKAIKLEYVKDFVVNSINISKENGMIKATVNIEGLNTSGDVTAKVIIALYDEDNKIIGIDLANKTSYQQYIEMYTTAASTIASAKLLVWDNLTDARPISSYVQISQSTIDLLNQ